MTGPLAELVKIFAKQAVEDFFGETLNNLQLDREVNMKKNGRPLRDRKAATTKEKRNYEFTPTSPKRKAPRRLF